MNTSVLFLPPETLEGHIIAYHPFCDILCAAGSVDSDGAIVWLVPQYERFSQQDKIPQIPSPAVNENVLMHPSTNPSYMPTKPELCLPLTTIAQAKFSPCGRYLAVVGTDTERERLFIYQIKIPKYYSEVDNQLLKSFRRCELQSVTLGEIAWSPDSSFIAVGNSNGLIQIIPVITHMPLFQFDSEKTRNSVSIISIKAVSGAVTGLSWSSDGYMIAVQSYNEVQILVKKICKKTSSYQKGYKFSKQSACIVDGQLVSRENPAYLQKGSEKYIMGQTSLRTFYAIALYKRQVAFSPDSSFMISTAGVIPVQQDQLKSQTFCSYVFTQHALCAQQTEPSIILPGNRTPSIGVAFSPVLYELDPLKKNVSDLSYRMVFAIASGCDVTIYDTQDFQPICVFEGENFQLDYVTSLSFNATGKQLCAFGAHFQYQFFDLSDEFVRKPVKLENYDYEVNLFRNYLMRQKTNYCQKLVDFNNQKLKTKPNKPAQIQMRPIKCTEGVKIFTVSEMHNYETHVPILLQIEKDEIEQITFLLTGKEKEVAKAAEKTETKDTEKVEQKDEYMDADVKE
ncbi:Transducin [Hexamita inflata]|uniref:Transducin n=1 Tax=Hexamita inflata TaxID=28002 RepID=A0AA86PUG9_9EUKA|nr:Transducin [Hexamita inflata]